MRPRTLCGLQNPQHGALRPILMHSKSDQRRQFQSPISRIDSLTHKSPLSPQKKRSTALSTRLTLDSRGCLAVQTMRAAAPSMAVEGGANGHDEASLATVFRPILSFAAIPLQ